MICNLCPRRCGAERMPDKAGGVCAMPTWPVAARAMLHQWEEPCLVGEHGAGAVFFSGCNLRCKFCQNGVISQEGYGKPITPRRLREIFEELVEQGAACLDLVTPTHFTDAVLEALGEERWPVPVVWNCGGYESVETLKRLEDRVQVVSAIGLHDESTGGATDPISAALIIADKTDVRRSRVREKNKATFDKHDRVNYAVTDTKLKINVENRVISLNLQIDPKICSMYEYFEIFLIHLFLYLV